MTRRRWIADEVDPGTGRAALTGAHAEHLVRVLRVRVGEEFDLMVGKESPQVRRARITKIEDARVVFELGEELASQSGLPRITLLLSIFKFDRMEWAIEKVVELGVSTIVPVIAARTQKHLTTSAAKRIERWRRIAQQASEQSRRNDMPEIGAPVSLKHAVEGRTEHCIVLSESMAKLNLRNGLALAAPGQSIALAVGPEGGWTTEELALFSAAGWQIASLGSNIFRAETAAIAALAVVMSEVQSD